MNIQSKQFFLNDLYEAFRKLSDQNKHFYMIAIDIANHFTSELIWKSKEQSDVLDSVIRNLKKFLNSDFYINNNKIILLIEDFHHSPLNIMQIINEIHQILTNPANLNHLGEICPIVSYFSAFIPEDTVIIEDFLKNMEIVFEKTRYSREKNHYHYNEAKKFIVNETLKTKQAEEFKYHIKKKSLSLAFQDIVERKSGTISHYECLLRLIKKDHSFLTVGPYIPIAEEYEFITSIDEIVLELVAEEARKNPDVCFSFNLSGAGIYNTNWLKRAKYLFKEYNIAKRIIVEITETSVKKDLCKVALFIISLQELGCRVALDDFGSGYTSFRQLKALPVDYVKIDGAFIKDIVSNPDNYLFVKLLLEMSHGIGCKVIAEYVETAATAKLLIELGVDYMQGNYFSPAVNYKPWENKGC